MSAMQSSPPTSALGLALPVWRNSQATTVYYLRTLSICKVQSFILFLRKSLTNRHLQTKAKSYDNEVKEASVQNGTSCLMANGQTFKPNNLKVNPQLRIYDSKQGLKPKFKKMGISQMTRLHLFLLNFMKKEG